MEAKDYKFYYPEQTEPSVVIDQWQVQRGTIQLIAGSSGCGKTTLLRQIMKEKGWQGKEQGTLENRGQKTSYVWQNPDSQIVTDRVEYEIVFPLENQGMPQMFMRRRLAEIVTNFGLEHLLGRDTIELSGGEKQILNVASAMVTEPDLLLLDEPTSQLDPVASRQLFELLKHICEEFGTTIIIAEQRLEEILPYADQLLLLEKGKIAAKGNPKEVYQEVKNTKMEIFFPSYMKLLKNQVALTKKEARISLNQTYVEVSQIRNTTKQEYSDWIEGKGIFLRFEKKGNDILQDCSFSIPKGTITCLVGGNGSGKTTLLRLLTKKIKPYNGKIKGMPDKVGYLPQNPSLLMLCDKVKEEWTGVNPELIQLFDLEKNGEQNPHDLSGGELQRLGLCKVLGTDNDCFLLDEPTKGLDGEMKKRLIRVLFDIKKKGKTVIVVSHDMEFVARLAEYVGLMFDGRMMVLQPVREFMEGNQYYTTSIHRVANQISNHIIIEEDMKVYAKEK